jgi:hypothetical protein
MKFNLILILLLLGAGQPFAADTFIKVQAKNKPTDPWLSYDTRLLTGLDGYDTSQVDTEYSKYGGLLRAKYSATGFFHTRKVGDRWFFVDPEGYLFLLS